MLFNGIWAGFVATPYLALAPVHYPRIAGYVVVPIIEVATFIMWLVGVILLGIDLPPAKRCDSAGCEAMLAAVVISAVEVYVAPLAEQIWPAGQLTWILQTVPCSSGLRFSPSCLVYRSINATCKGALTERTALNELPPKLPKPAVLWRTYRRRRRW